MSEKKKNDNKNGKTIKEKRRKYNSDRIIDNKIKNKKQRRENKRKETRRKKRERTRKNKRSKHTEEQPSSNLGLITGYFDRGFSWFLSDSIKTSKWQSG
jgi:hypothetical protein